MNLRWLPLVLTFVAVGYSADPSWAARVKEAMASSISLQAHSVATMRATVEIQQTSLRRSATPPMPVHYPAQQSVFTNLSGLSHAPFWKQELPACNRLSGEETDHLINEAAERRDLEPDVLRAVMKQESGFLPCAVSPKGALGLMQLMPSTAAELGVKNPLDPRENTEAGAKLLKRLLTTYGDLALALSAYNAGPGRVDEAGGAPSIPETQNYVRSILTTLGMK